MSFRRSRQDVCDMLNGGPARFKKCEILSVFYETTEEAVADVLPPGLKPYKRPLIMAGINNFVENDFGPAYWEAALYVAAVHESTGIRGFFVVGMALNDDMGTILGREAGGYPKKMGALSFQHEGNHVEGSAERHGIRFFTIKGDLTGAPNDPGLMQAIGEMLTPPDPEGHPGAAAIFTYQWPAYLWIHAKDVSKVPPPLLNTLWKTKMPTDRKAEIGMGEVLFKHSKQDPWDSLPVIKTLGATMTYDQADLGVMWSPEDEYPVDAIAYLPHAFYGVDAKLD